MNPRHQSLDAYLPLVGRVLLSLLFIFHGASKLLGFSGAVLFMNSHGFPMPEIVAGTVIIVELGCGLALLLGFQTRIAAYCISVVTLVLTFVVYRDFREYEQLTQILKNLAIVGGLLFAIRYADEKRVEQNH